MIRLALFLAAYLLWWPGVSLWAAHNGHYGLCYAWVAVGLMTDGWGQRERFCRLARRAFPEWS
jgi:hypothetical protein